MKNSKIKIILEQILVASVLLVGFLLAFENSLRIPIFLQPIGRLHTVVLHFPIVILLIVAFLEIIRHQSSFKENKALYVFSETLLLVGALSSSLTVIMGIFLAREAGYNGSELIWHRWLGAATYLTALINYLILNKSWYNLKLYPFTSAILFCLIIATGHFGGNLTHGKNFVFEPLMEKKEVQIENAVVFKDLVQPILEKKCVACHNPDIIKGELLMSDVNLISKGGKSGPLFIPGKPENSLMIQRIHLSVDDKKHMPPFGKPQLTEDEKLVLSWWIKDMAPINKKVMDLPSSDSLRILAAKMFKSTSSKMEKYEFDEADPKLIQKLSNETRTILLFAKDSPALSVNFYNKSKYQAIQLDELKEIKEQVVALSLAKMPVKDKDLGFVKVFENLHTLNLNFTDISAQGLKELSNLKGLLVLSLSGTKLQSNVLVASIKSIPSLKKLYIWDAGLGTEEIKFIQKQLKGIQVIGGFQDDGLHPLKLNTPQVKNASTIFDESILAELIHPIKGVEIRYSLDGTALDSVRSPVFSKGLLLKKNTSIKARAFKKGWLGSDEIIFDFYRGHFKPDSSVLMQPLNRVHQAAGSKTFIDGRLGTFNANSPAWANNWAGVRNNDLELIAFFKNAIPLSSVELRIMVETETSIFPPELVEIWGATIENKWKLIAKIKPTMPKENFPHTLPLLGTRFKTTQVKYLKIVAKPLEKIPAWHPGKDKRALLLIDEMFFN